MRCLILVFALFAWSASAGDELAKPYTPKVGELVALDLGQFLSSWAKAVKTFDAPVWAHYDAKDKRIEVVVLGMRDSVDGAKQTLQQLPMDELYERGKLYGVTLSASNVVAVYLLRGKGREVVRFEDGKYVSR